MNRTHKYISIAVVVIFAAGFSAMSLQAAKGRQIKAKVKTAGKKTAGSVIQQALHGGASTSAAVQQLNPGGAATDCVTAVFRIWQESDIGQNKVPETSSSEKLTNALSSCAQASQAETAYRATRGLKTIRKDVPKPLCEGCTPALLTSNINTYQRWINAVQKNMNRQDPGKIVPCKPRPWNSWFVPYYTPPASRGGMTSNPCKNGERPDLNMPTGTWIESTKIAPNADDIKKMLAAEKAGLDAAAKETDPVKKAELTYRALYAGAWANDNLRPDPNIWMEPSPEQIARKSAVNQAYIDWQIEKELAEKGAGKKAVQAGVKSAVQEAIAQAAKKAAQEAQKPVQAQQEASAPGSEPGSQPGSAPESSQGSSGSEGDASHEQSSEPKAQEATEEAAGSGASSAAESQAEASSPADQSSTPEEASDKNTQPQEEEPSTGSPSASAPDATEEAPTES